MQRDLAILTEVALGQPVGALRAAPLSLGGGGAPPAVLVAYSADYDVDPFHEMYFHPTDTLKLCAFTAAGEVVWRRDLGRGVLPGMWFCPVLPFDLDGDGADEVWFVGNPDENRPLALSRYRLTRLDGRTGEVTGEWPWPNLGGHQPMSHAYRNFLLGGHVRGRPVLVTAQGTYGDMFLQAYDPGVVPRWRVAIPRDAPGARGAHMHPVADLDDDGCDEFLWGERCLSFDTGAELFCCDRDSYRGHSDCVQPVRDPGDGLWRIYTFRESDPAASPRVVTFDAGGRRLWGQVHAGHMDMGWVARLHYGGGHAARAAHAAHVATAIRIGHKTSGPGGHGHSGREEFAFDLTSGEPLDLGFPTYQTLPVDLDGDGLHELVRGLYRGDGTVLDGVGREVGSIGGPAALACKFLEAPGEQVLAFSPDGVVRAWGDPAAEDSDAARERYAHPSYAANRRLAASGFHINCLGGL